MRNVADMAGACPDSLLTAENAQFSPKRGSSTPWFALRVREKMRVLTEERLVPVVENLFSPTTKETRQWSDRKKVVAVPLFPGYLFAQVEMDRRIDALKVIGVIDIVRVANRPAEVDSLEIAALRQAMTVALPVEALPELVQGQAVRVIAGPMRGVEGTLSMVKSEMKLVLAVTMMQRSVAVEIDQTHVMPI